MTSMFRILPSVMLAITCIYAVIFGSQVYATEFAYYDLREKPVSQFEDIGYVLSSQDEIVISVVVRNSEIGKAIFATLKNLELDTIAKLHFAFIIGESLEANNTNISMFHVKRKVGELDVTDSANVNNKLRVFVGEGIELTAIIQAAADALSKNNDLEAFRLMKIAAEKGNRESQFVLATLFREGRGTQKSIERAIEWDHRAAEQKHRSALFRLGRMYSIGEEVTEDLERGHRLMLAAAEGGMPKAALLVGLDYDTGSGVPQDLDLAAHWYLQSADVDGGVQAYSLGYRMYLGKDIPENFELAKRLLKAAEMAGHKDASTVLGIMAEHGPFSDLKGGIVDHQRNIDVLKEAIEALHAK